MDEPETKSIELEDDNNNDQRKLLREIYDYQSRQIFIITKELEEKIPSILSYLQNDKNDPNQKIQIIEYIMSLIQNIPYNLDLILANKSDNQNQKMNLYEIIIHQYIYSNKKEGKYIELLKQLLNLIFKRLSHNKDLYRYMLSYISHFLNIKNNNEKSSNDLNEYNYHQLLDLILLFYQSPDNEEPINYFYFNGDINTHITLKNSYTDLLKLNTNLYILLFVKLIDYKYISPINEKENNKNESNILNIKFKDTKNNFSINIKYKDENTSTPEGINVIDIPYKEFNIKETNNILIKITPNLNIDIYVNSTKINIPSDILKERNKNNTLIESINFFNGFYGLCSTIMIYRDVESNKIEYLFPKYLLEREINKDITPKEIKLKDSISKFFQNGFHKESLLVPFVKADIKNNIEAKNIMDNTLMNLNDQNLDDLKRFIYNNLISIYIPTRTIINSFLEEKKEGNRQIYSEIREIILIDSINNFHANLNYKEIYPNLIYGQGGGIHILTNILNDFSMDIDGISHLIPLIELMTDYNELLTKENFTMFINIILFVFSNHQDIISNELNSKFFYYLSLFLEKIPEQFYNDLAVNIKSILLTLECLETSNNQNHFYAQEFFNHVFMNEKILFKFDFNDRKLIYEQIFKFLKKQNDEQKYIDIDAVNIINILLHHEKNKYTHFCCKKHAEYFKKETQIMNPELNVYIKPIIDIIDILLKQFSIEVNKNEVIDENSKTRYQLIKIFELLTFDITPCLQANILNLFFKYIKNERCYEFLNINNFINIITLYVFKISLFDVKELAFNYLIELINKKANNNNMEQYIEQYLTYFYYSPIDEDKQNIKNLKNNFSINNIKYNLITLSENQKELLSYYDKNHYNQLMNNLFDKASYFFKEKICIKVNFNILLSIASKCDSNFIIKFLTLIQGELNRKTPTNVNLIDIIYKSQKLLQWLLDTCYQSFLIKKYNFNKDEFVPGFSLGEINNEKERDEVIRKIITLSSNLLLEIFYNNIYKLDYLMTWSKYYEEIKEDKNKFGTVHKFIFDYFFEKIINKVIDSKSKNESNKTKFTLNQKLYLINIIFEYFTIYRITGFSSGGILKDFENLYNQVCPPFIYTLIPLIKINKDEEDNIHFLKDKWDEYSCIKKLFGDLDLLGLGKANLKINDEKNIYEAFIQNKNNMFINELKIYFSNFSEIFANNNSICNKGAELIILKYHYYTMLLTVITDEIEFKEIINDLRAFILLIIISSTTLSIDNTKPSNSENKKNKEIWPTEKDYKNIQNLVKIILFNIFSFLLDKIVEIENNIKSNENNNNKEIKNLLDNNNSIRKYLINTLLFFFRVLNTIYSDLKKQEFVKKNSTGIIKGMFNKIKSKIISDKEGIQLTGGYKFINEFITNCLIEKKINENESQNSNSNDNFTVIEEKNFLDDIPAFSLNSLNEKDYKISDLNTKLENIYIKDIKNNAKIKNYFFDYKDKYQRQLFPFVKYILQRSKSILYIIPTYDNSVNIHFNFNFLCLKPNYLPELSNKIIKMENIQNFVGDLINEIRMYQIKLNFNEHDKIRSYRKIKKKLFSFNGIYSTKEYFYEKNKYICKYRLLNHMTEDYTKIFLTPIIDINYYLPKFSKFELKNLFRPENKDHLIQITKITDLSLKEKNNDENNKKKNIEFSNFNGLYLLKESEFKSMNELNIDIEGTFNHYLFFKKFIQKKHSISGNYHNSIENTCLVKSEYHIRGFFYNNKNGIGFYSYDKIPYTQEKKIDRVNVDEKIQEIQKDYDTDRKACFGSIFSPQKEKYEYLHFEYSYNDIIFILKRRYYFKVSALEIFTTDKKSYLFKFDHNKLEDILSNIRSYLNPKPEDIYIEYNKFYNKIGFININSMINNMNKIIYEKNYMNLKNLYDQWKKWEISTMRLFMIINIYGNRSLNDINQYPVFPWIIIDYKSDKFPNINSPKDVIRPLDTPMGMLEINEDAKQRKQDYMDYWEISKDDDDKEDEFDRYGSHYSTSLYVSYYLVRIFPFANIRIELQGTSFDDPNRLFNSIRTSFDCSSTQKSDLRELVPELFCLPEILLNNNDFNLGVIKDNSETDENNNTKEPKMKLIQEVETPKWCNNNAYFFIKKHRELLESFEVSNTINEWLNLIFGSKQKGSAGNKIKNLYNLQTYEDYEQTFDNMSQDDQEITCRMLEFGVTPNQIFKSDTSQRMNKLDTKIKRQLFFNTIENYKKGQLNKIENKDYLIFDEIKGEINFNNALKIYYFPKDNIKKNIYIMSNYNLYIYIRKIDKVVVPIEDKPEMQQFADPYGGEIGQEYYDEIKNKIIEKKEAIILNNFKYGIKSNKQPNIWLDKGTILVKGGFWNGNIILKNIIKEKENSNNKINNINSNEENKRIYIYTTCEYSPIMKIVIDKNETFAICGNTNGTIYIFKIKQSNKLIWSLYKNINDHNSSITSIAINENLNIAISCSQNGLCMLYTLPYFKLFNSFIIGKKEKNCQNEDEILCPDIVLISDSPLPCFIFYINLKRSIYFYSINGHILKRQQLSFSIQENSIKIYRDFQFVDYLVIYNSNYKAFDIYTMIDFILIKRSKSIPDVNYDFIDFIISEELDHALVLCKAKDKKNIYKIFMLKDSECKDIWK